MKSLHDLDLQGKRVLLRVDLNVPLDEQYNITDYTRLDAIIPTVQAIREKGASVILMSHLGRPKGGYEEKFSLAHLLKSLNQKLGTTLRFAKDCIGEEGVLMAQKMQAGDVMLLENLRFYKEEEKGDKDFAKRLASLGNVYINDAFGTAHRAHASTAVMAQFFTEKGAGFVMKAELDNAKKVLDNAQRPFTAIMGGAKISDKILVIEQLLDKVDNLIIVGGMSYTFFKAQGGEIGKSLVENDKLDLATTLLAKAKAKNINLMLPEDSVIADAFSNDANTQIADNFHIPENYMGLDIAGKSIAKFAEVIKNSKTILWNGPAGVFEMSNFAKGTEAIAQAVVEATEKNGAFSLIGGGDSASAVNNLGYGERVSYVSTGGGALLEYMEGKILPGVEALD